MATRAGSITINAKEATETKLELASLATMASVVTEVERNATATIVTTAAQQNRNKSNIKRKSGFCGFYGFCGF